MVSETEQETGDSVGVSVGSWPAAGPQIARKAMVMVFMVDKNHPSRE
jgi:hypothetical protein